MTAARRYKLPTPGTTTYNVIMALHAAPTGAMTLLELTEKFRKVTTTTITQIATTYSLHTSKRSTYRLPENLRRLIDGAEPDPEPEATPVTPPRVFNAWTPAMTNYEATMRRAMRS